jgi:hypothetical protein
MIYSQIFHQILFVPVEKITFEKKINISENNIISGKVYECSPGRQAS